MAKHAPVCLLHDIRSSYPEQQVHSLSESLSNNILLDISLFFSIFSQFCFSARQWFEIKKKAYMDILKKREKHTMNQ